VKVSYPVLERKEEEGPLEKLINAPEKLLLYPGPLRRR
jgi:hypothetical protein